MLVEIDGGVAAGLTLEVSYYSAMAFGGPDTAEIRAIGAADALAQIGGWLRRAVVIYSDAGTVVWSGYVHEVRIGQPGRTVGASLAEMGNKIKILYTRDNAEGVEESAETDWAFDYDSMTRYGTIERKLSAGGALRIEEANAMLAMEVTKRGKPELLLSPSGDDGGLVLCRGWWHTADWCYFERPGVRVEFTEQAGAATHTVGWQLTSNQIGFIQQYIHHLGAQLNNLKPGDVFSITGSASNDGMRIVESGTNDARVTITSTTLYFEANDDIRDPTSGMGGLRAPGMIYITNGGPNTGYRLIEQATPSYLNVDGAFGGIVNFTPSGTRTIEQGHAITTTTRNNTEAPGATVTLAKYSTIGQAWRMPLGETWRLSSIAVRCKRVGIPPAPLTVQVRTDAGGAPSETSVATGTISLAPKTMSWVQVDFDHSWAPTAGELYWIVLSTSNLAADAWYEVELNDQTLAPEGQALVYVTGTTWIGLPSGAASVLFRVRGAVAVDALLGEMLAQNPLFSLADVQTGAGVWRHPYATGELTLRDALEKIMALGGVNGARISAWVDERRAVAVRGAKAATMSDWRWTAENRLVNAGGGDVEPGMLPAGRWIWVDGLPAALADVGRSVFIERAEYDAQTGRMTLTPAQRLDPLRLNTFDLR